MRLILSNGQRPKCASATFVVLCDHGLDGYDIKAIRFARIVKIRRFRAVQTASLHAGAIRAALRAC